MTAGRVQRGRERYLERKEREAEERRVRKDARDEWEQGYAAIVFGAAGTVAAVARSLDISRSKATRLVRMAGLDIGPRGRRPKGEQR